jgi:bacteriocin biosynthesis cyclodehydratase domain-containing protein
MMLTRPRFRPHLRVESVEGEGVFLMSETGLTVLTGKPYQVIAPLIDGRRSVDEIIDLVRDRLHPVHAYHAIADLEEKGHLTESGEYGETEAEAALWSIQNIEPQDAIARLANAAVNLSAFGEVATEPLQETLLQLHVRTDEAAQLGVVLTDDYLRAGLAAYNQNSLESSRPWLLVKPVGCQLWIGPLFHPGKTGCWECLANRLRFNRQVESYVHTRKGRPEPLSIARGYNVATLQIAWNLVAWEIARWVARGESPLLEGKIQTFDLLRWQMQAHVLVRRPQCPVCGDPRKFLNASAPPVVLQSRRKSCAEAGFRVVDHAATLQRYGHHVSPITGAVPHLERCEVTNDGALHVYLTGPNYSRPAESLAHIRKDLRNRNSGKGTTDSQARTSGLCEALERYSGAFRGDEPRRRARFRELGEAAIHPNACMLFSDRQYNRREEWNASQSFFTRVPVRFDAEAEIDWTPIWSLTRQEVHYLPTSFCYYSYPSLPEQRYCASCSNGCAAGNTLEEAILQGFLELVERDSVALWWYNRVRRPGVDLASFDEPYLQQANSALATRHRNLWVLDVTSDLDIPVFAAVSQRTDCDPARILLGFGAHLDPRLALLRAVSECVQVLVSFFPLESQEKELEVIQESLTLNWLRTATPENQPYLLADSRCPQRVASDYRNLSAGDLKEDILACQARIERLGLEVLVLDQTRPDIGLPVVKVVVPGLRHFFARFAPGRLYDVPVQLGWLKQPLAEEQLNPQPMFL